MDGKIIRVAIAGLSTNPLRGRTARVVANSILTQKDLMLSDIGIGSPNSAGNKIEIGGKTITIIGNTQNSLQQNLGMFDMAVDYTTGNVAIPNIEAYVGNNIPFVMGTTGVDMVRAAELVKNSKISAVIYPNMSLPIVAFLSGLKHIAEEFPDVFAGYTLRIIESHQSRKDDTSGTARKAIGYFNVMGIPFTENQIEMIRDPKKQLEMGIPEEHIDGHGWHRYIIVNEAEGVSFDLSHNVNGRDTYAAGTLKAIRYLHAQILRGRRGEVFSMLDVAKGIQN